MICRRIRCEYPCRVFWKERTMSMNWGSIWSQYFSPLQNSTRLWIPSHFSSCLLYSTCPFIWFIYIDLNRPFTDECIPWGSLRDMHSDSPSRAFHSFLTFSTLASFAIIKTQFLVFWTSSFHLLRNLLICLPHRRRKRKWGENPIAKKWEKTKAKRRRRGE